MTITFNEHRLEDVIKYIAQVTGADIEVFWTDDKNSVGLDKDQPITLSFEKGSALELLEKVLEKATTDGKGNSWQLSGRGDLQAGPKERLNAFRSVRIYSIADLLTEAPTYDNAPDFDLQSVLQSRAGGGSQNPFKDNTQTKVDKTPLPDRVKELQGILLALVEPDQWIENGGNAASIHYLQGSFLVNAPDYIHRQIDGYPYWSRVSRPAATSARVASVADNVTGATRLANQDAAATATAQLASCSPRCDSPGADAQPFPSGAK
jgi:hypothetical protein